jgi:HK97 gp10 family phage protein
MSALTIKVTKRSDRISQVMGKKRKEVADAAGRNTQAAASLMYQLSPVGEATGPDHVHMRDTIAIEQRSETNFVIVIAKKVGKYFLWRLLEFGTRFMEAQPLVRPSLESARRGFLSDLQKLGFKRK